MKYIDADLLRKEIERELSAHDKVDHLEAFEVGKAWNRGHRCALENLLSFIASLQQEQLSLPDHLDEAADAYYSKNYCDVDDGPSVGMARDAFIAGAQWMKDQLTVK